MILFPIKIVVGYNPYNWDLDPRLKQNNQKHWFDGEIIQHPHQDLAALFDQYYQEALDAGYCPEDYLVEPFGEFKKVTQKN